MPKGNRGSRGKRTQSNGGTVHIEWKGKILLGGPAHRENELREKLEWTIREWLDECDVFNASGLAERYAFRIAWSVVYQTPKAKAKPKRDKLGRFKRGGSVPTVMHVGELDVIYRNPPKEDKWWIRIRNNENTVVPGWWVGDE